MMKDWAKLLPDVTKLLTKHFTTHAAGRKVEYIVIHYNAGDLTVEGCWSVWQTREASAHYQVESGGRIGQLVYDKDIAWHAGNWTANTKSIGIEHANKSGGTIAEECLDNGSHLVAALCHYYNLGRPEWGKNVFPHSHFVATSCPGQIYGSQKDAYIQRAQYWYDVMDGKDVEKPTSTGSTSSGSSSSSSSSSSTLDLGTDLGVWGPKFTKALQAQRGTTQDGIISGQAKSDSSYFWAVEDSTRKFGSGGSDVMQSLQSMLIKAGYSCGSKGADRYYGKSSIKAHQKWLNAKVNAGLTVDGYHGNATNKAMAKALQKGLYK